MLRARSTPLATEYLGIMEKKMEASYYLRFRVEDLEIRALPKGSYVVPFWVSYGFLGMDYNILPTKELHRRVWVS